MISFFTVNEKSLFLPFRYLYPECLLLIEKHLQAFPLLCLKSDCPANKNCMEVVAKRVNYWFTHIEPKAELMFAYFKYRDSTSLRAGVFNKNLDEPKYMVLNPSGFAKLQRENSIIKQYNPSMEYLNINGVQQLPQIIPVTSLIR